MAGLFDQFNNMNPEQTQGLLAAAAQMLQQSGPSRTPTSFGQVLGGGIGAYQGATAEAQRRKQEQEQAAQMAQMRAQQMQMGQFDLAQRQRGDAEEQAMQGAYREGGNDPQALIDAVSRVNPMKGMELRAKLAKQAPKFDTKPQVGVGPDGKPFTYLIAEDGTQRRLDDTLPRDQLKFLNLDGKTVGVNEFSGAAGPSFQHTQSAASLASNALTARGQNMADARAREFNASRREEVAAKTALGKAPTEFQGKSAAFGLRATEADKTITELTGKYSPAALNTKQALGSVWGVGGMLEAGGNALLSNDGQRAEQAQRDFINAVLRQESGAAIGESEFANAKRQYFPQPNDGQAVIAQKARDRQLAIQGFQANAGRHALTAPGAAPAEAGAVRKYNPKTGKIE